MREKPLRGQKYFVNGELFTFLEIAGTYARGFFGIGTSELIPLEKLPLKIIDTKDYERIEGTKHKGD